MTIRMGDIRIDTINRARVGEPESLEALLIQIQPTIYNLAVRMLGNRDDALDASQTILLKVLTHLNTWRGEAEFSTWVFQVARNHLLTALTSTREFPATSLDQLQAKLDAGLAYGMGDAPLTPEDKADARDLAVRCTQGMLMCLDRDGRLTYLLDVVFHLNSSDAARVLDIAPTAYRQRLSRTRAQLHAVTGQVCGLIQPDAACRCDRQLPAARARPASGLSLTEQERLQASDRFDGLVEMSDAAALMRAHPDYQAPAVMTEAIRTLLERQGYWPA